MLEFCCYDNQVIDIFTKPIKIKTLLKLKKMMGENVGFHGYVDNLILRIYWNIGKYQWIYILILTIDEIKIYQNL